MELFHCVDTGPKALAVLVTGLVASGMGCGGGEAGTRPASLRRSEASTRSHGSSPSHPRHAIADYDGDDYEAGGDADDDDNVNASDSDGDSDGSQGAAFDQDDVMLIDSGRPAGAADRREVSALVKRYFAAAGGAHGAVACGLVAASVARAVPEVIGGPTGRPYARGNTCPEILSSVFRFFGAQLAAEASAVEVTRVRVEGNQATVVLGFKAIHHYPARVMSLIRQGHAWRVDGILDNELP
jgi:hypothetical protein